MTAAASSLHLRVLTSVALNVKLALVEAVGLAGFDAGSIVVLGATVSVVQVKLAGVGSVLPAPSTPRARKVCEPSGRLVSGIETGELQAAKAALSRLHWSVEAASVVIVNEAAMLLGLLGVTVNVVSGATVSTVQVNVAGVGSVLPIESVAATLKACGPSVTPLSVTGFEHAVATAPSREHLKVDGVFDETNTNWPDV